MFTLLLAVAPPINVGRAPGVDRRVGVITGGRFEGDRLAANCFPAAAATGNRSAPDGAWLINVRIVLKTDDEAVIGMPYTGIRQGPQEVLDRIARGEAVKATDIICASRRRSRPRRKNMAGSTTSSASASATACRKGRSTRCSKCCSKTDWALARHCEPAASAAPRNDARLGLA